MASGDSISIMEKHPRDIRTAEAITAAEGGNLESFLRDYGIYEQFTDFGCKKKELWTIFDNLFTEFNIFPGRHEVFYTNMLKLVTAGFLRVYTIRYRTTENLPKFHILEKLIIQMWKHSYASETVAEFTNLFNVIMEESAKLDLFRLHNHTFERVFDNLRSMINPLDLNVQSQIGTLRTSPNKIDGDLFLAYVNHVTDEPTDMAIYNVIEQFAMFFDYVDGVYSIHRGFLELYTKIGKKMMELERFATSDKDVIIDSGNADYIINHMGVLNPELYTQIK